MSTESHVHGDDPDTEGRAVPPYEDRRTSGDVDDQSESTKAGAKVGGATGPVADAETKAPELDSEEGVGPDHGPGTSRGEDLIGNE